MKEFKFEHTMKLTEAEYIAIWSSPSTRSPVRSVRLMALLAVGIILLFSAYTLLAGVTLLLLFTLNYFKPGLVSIGARSTFQQQKYMKGTLTYGVSDEKLWIKGAAIEASAAWSLLGVWRETAGLLILSASGIPPVYLPVERLKETGLYEKVRALAQEHGREYRVGRCPGPAI